MKSHQTPCGTALAPARIPRLPPYRPSRLEEAPFWLLGLAALCVLVCFYASILGFVPTAHRFLTRMQNTPTAAPAPAYADIAVRTNQTPEATPLVAPNDTGTPPQRARASSSAAATPVRI